MALPFGLFGCAIALAAGFPIVPAIVSSAIVLITTFVAITIGHGEQMDVGKTPRGIESPNEIDHIVAWLYRLLGKEPDYDSPTFEGIGLGITGLAQTLPIGILACFITPFVGIPLALSGFLKWPCYVLGNAYGRPIPGFIGETDQYGRNPDAGEFVFGFVLGLQLLVAAIALGVS